MLRSGPVLRVLRLRWIAEAEPANHRPGSGKAKRAAFADASAMPDAPPAWTPATPPPARNPMEGHLKAIAVLNLVFGGFTALGALAILIAFLVGSAVAGGTAKVPWLSALLAGLGILLVVLVAIVAALFFAAGGLLLKRRPAGKVLAFITAILMLPGIPLGTAFGVYSLVILTRPETAALLVAR